MPIDPEAIQRYLAYVPTKRPDFKGENYHALRRHIAQDTGVELNTRTPLRQHQLEGLAFALHMMRCLLFYDTRLGKTKMALDWATHLRHAGLWSDAGLVIAHAPVALDVWEFEASKHSALNVRAVRNLAQLEQAISENVDLIVVTWSVLQAMFTIKKKSRKGQPKLYPDRAKLRQVAGCWSLCIIDEIHRCKNEQGLWFAMAAELVRKCTFRIGLTGTPFGRFPLDVWAQAYLIDDGDCLGTSPQFFRTAFSKKVKNWFSPTKESLAFDESLKPILQTRIESISMAYARAEVTQVSVLDNRVELRMSPEQRNAYNDVISGVITRPDDLDPVEVGSTFSRLRMISSGYLPYTDDELSEHVLHFPHPSKLDWLRDLLMELGDVPTVIFHEYTHTGLLICKLLTELKIKHSWLYGQARDKGAARRAFVDGNAQVLVANTATGGTAIDLNRADYLLFFESPTSPIVRQQAEARPLGERGQRVLIMDDLVSSPVDKRVLDFISEGKDILRTLIHGKATWKSLRA
jgi:SNF2 family DNA or RNA helicase